MQAETSQAAKAAVHWAPIRLARSSQHSSVDDHNQPDVEELVVVRTAPSTGISLEGRLVGGGANDEHVGHNRSRHVAATYCRSANDVACSGQYQS